LTKGPTNRVTVTQEGDNIGRNFNDATSVPTGTEQKLGQKKIK